MIFVSLFTVFMYRSRTFNLYGDVTTAGEGLQNLGLCSALRTFVKGGIFKASVFLVSSEGPLQLVAFYDNQGNVEDLF
jgi:hypothetical protein